MQWQLTASGIMYVVDVVAAACCEDCASRLTVTSAPDIIAAVKRKCEHGAV